MSLQLHGQQGAPRSFTAALRFKSSASLAQPETMSSDDSPATSTSTDTSYETSVYDPSDVDPFKHVSSPPSASQSHFTEESLYPFSDSSSSPPSPGVTSLTPLIPSLTRLMGTPEDTSRFYLPRNDRRVAHRPLSSYLWADSSDIEQKQRSVAEHNQLQSKIQRVFELAKAGGQHLKEMMALKSDIEDFFRRTPGVVTDSDSTDSVEESPSPAVYQLRCVDEYPFHSMPITPPPNALGLSVTDDETLVDEERDPRTDPDPPFVVGMPRRTVKPSKIPRMNLAPLMIIKKPTLSSVTACTVSPTPSQTGFRGRPLLRSFSAPTLFSGQDDASTSITQTEAFPHYIKAKMTYITMMKQDTSGELSPTKSDLNFYFEPPGGKEQPRSRFSSSSTILPASRRDRWYRPKFVIPDSAKGWSFSKSTSKTTTSGLHSIFQERLPSVSEIPESSPSRSCNDMEPPPSGRRPLSRGYIASGRWSTDWDQLLSKIGKEQLDRGDAAMVLHNPKPPDTTPGGDTWMKPVGLLMPRGPAQIRKVSLGAPAEISSRRTAGVFNRITLQSKAPPVHDPVPDTTVTQKVQRKNALGCPVYLPTIPTVLDNAVNGNTVSGVVRTFSVSSRLSYTSVSSSRPRSLPGSLKLKRTPETASKIPAAITRSSSHLGFSPRSDGRRSRGSGISGLLANFPDPPIRNSTSRFFEGLD